MSIALHPNSLSMSNFTLPTTASHSYSGIAEPKKIVRPSKAFLTYKLGKHNHRSGPTMASRLVPTKPLHFPPFLPMISLLPWCSGQHWKWLPPLPRPPPTVSWKWKLPFLPVIKASCCCLFYVVSTVVHPPPKSWAVWENQLFILYAWNTVFISHLLNGEQTLSNFFFFFFGGVHQSLVEEERIIGPTQHTRKNKDDFIITADI